MGHSGRKRRKELEAINKRIETMLDIVLEHFGDTEDRFDGVEEQLNALKSRSGFLKMALSVLAREDAVGNNASHFFKSGNVLRNPKNEALNMRRLLPDNGLYKTNLEYDLWYDVGGKR